MANTKAKSKFDAMSIVIILGCVSALFFILGGIGYAVNDFLYDGRPGWIGNTSALVLSCGIAGIFGSTLIFAGNQHAPKKSN
ncbi:MULTISPECIES: hypothetical protein [Pseudomonas]|uniref:hypothetical protein n=1 Tax=Pseudomonas TaxID=286 RepID=UPI00070B7AB5|nr:MULTISPECIES: hypothetical protein [Pseudomonas]KQW19905.1 hypothetical protein ASC85_08635 [Pseudomonas sp. Root401]WHS57490.1 hypothetical protein QLH64_31210 [Pseudomonas brassicacearum]